MIASNKTGIVNIYSVYGFNSRNKISIERNKTMNVSKKYEINDINFTERGELLLAMDNGSVMVYYRDTDKIEFVIDAHLYSIGNIYVIEDKQALLSTSEDRSIRMVEFPEFYPGQMIRKELTNLNHSSIKNKTGFNEDNEDKYINAENNDDNDSEMNNKWYQSNSKINMNFNNDMNEKKNKEEFQIMISVPINKSYENIFSDDLDGWDDEIEEFK